MRLQGREHDSRVVVAVPGSSVRRSSVAPTSAAMSDRVPLSIYSLYIINKAGGLIFQKDFAAVPKLSTNDYLRLASTFHSLHAITARGIHIAPAGANEAKKTPAVAASAATTVAPTTGGGASSASAAAVAFSQGDTLPPVANGISCLESKSFRLHCFQSLTGLKFMLIASASFGANALEKVLQAVYLVYTDHVLKNPFYELEMPIRIEQFETNLARVIAQAIPGGGAGGANEGRREKKESSDREKQEAQADRDK